MCIQNITSETELLHGRKLIDKLRFFHSNDSSAQLEAGHQKGGNYFCPTCTIKATEIYCLHKFYRTDVKNLKMKQEKVLKGPVASSNIKIGKKSMESALSPFIEGEQRLFQQAKSLTKHTSNNQPGNVISNIFLCSKVEEELKIHFYGQHGEIWVNEQNTVSNLYNEMTIVKNTFIKKEFIRKYGNDWQSYLETKANFISLGEGFSSCQNENGTNISQAMPELHHYRSWNLHEE